MLYCVLVCLLLLVGFVLFCLFVVVVVVVLGGLFCFVFEDVIFFPSSNHHTM